MWGLHAKLANRRPSFCSIKIHAPFFKSVVLLVASKQRDLMLLVTPLCYTAPQTDVAMFSPVSVAIFGIQNN